MCETLFVFVLFFASETFCQSLSVINNKSRIIEERSRDGTKDLITHGRGQRVSGPQMSLFANNSCVRDLVYINEHLDEDWAKRMIEASSHPKVYLLNWETNWSGDEDYCRQAVQGEAFQGKYCIVEKTIMVKVNESIRTLSSLCLPDSCKPYDILRIPIVAQLMDPWTKARRDDAITEITNAGCLEVKVFWDSSTIAMVCFIGVFVVLATIGTGLTIQERLKARMLKSEIVSDCDGLIGLEMQNPVDEDDDMMMSLLAKRGRFKPIKDFLKCFCLIRNRAKLLEIRNTPDSRQLSCLHGIRFLSMSWIIIIHSYTSAIDAYGIMDKDEIGKSMFLMNDLPFQAVVQAAFGVDTFFLLSGTLVGYFLLQELSIRNGKVSWLYFYFHRYWRLTPLLAIVQASYLTLVSRSLRRYSPDGASCKWWLSLLYINNLHEETLTCMSWVWYLADDMQFYVISPIFIYALWRWPRVGLTLTLSVMLSSWVASGLITWQRDLIPGYSLLSETKDFLEYGTKTGLYFLTLYIKPYGRIGPYLIGILLAHYLVKHRAEKTAIKPYAAYFMWALSVIVSLINVYGVHGTSPGKTAATVYNALSRSCFAACVAWVIYACINGYGGVVNWILSRDVFAPLSRLTYSVYLIHPIFYEVIIDGMKTPLYMTHMFMVTLFFSCLIFCYALSYIITLLFESPFMAMEKIIFDKKKS